MTKNLTFAVATLAALAFAAPIVHSQQNTATSPSQDASFALNASAAGETEIAASRMAEKQSQSAQVKTFALTMIHDHTQANVRLAGLARKDGLTVSDNPTAAQDAALAQLKPLSGASFDHAYIAMMQNDHRNAVALFQSESTTGSNSDIKSFATQTLPTVQHHLTMANALKG